MKNLLFYIFSWLMFNLSFFIFLISLYMYNYHYILMMDWNFVNFLSIKLNYLILLDWICLIYLSVVLLIMSMILLYSIDYMMGDLKIMRFFWLLNLFVLSMLFMIISPNMVSILLGWDGLGLVSYCLVIYYHNMSSYNSGMVTVLLNRVGDVMILIVIGLMYFNYSMNFFLKFEDLGFIIIIMFILVGMTKSAQIPFSSWLPLAMAAPTPVSSLVHSSTLVTAGVYLLIRFSKVLMISMWSDLLLFISIMTMFMSGLVANFEYDLKKIVALSTLSQLGLMMMILSLNYEILSFFHLVMHALFKSLLFMCVGYIIHNFNNMQDMRFMGFFSLMSPYVMMSLVISNMALCGFPFLSGFFSKDLILEKLFFMKVNLYIFILFLLSIGLTISYTMRMMLMIYFNMNLIKSLMNFSENFHINFSMILLMMFSVFMGMFFMWNFFDWLDLNILSFFIKFVILLMILTGMMIGFCFYKLNLFYQFFYKIMYFNGLMWNMMNLLKMIYLNSYKKFEFYNKNLEKGWNEMMGLKLIEFFIIKDIFSNIILLNLFNKSKGNFVYMISYLLLIMYFLLIFLN
uniref:NADH:ubiquinone reductase (H(+)-translocating) n=1 Tax=Gasteruption parvicollarium TaxID=1738629 RepID=A0A2S0AZR4_9HYME|nr:NADH dehydrogenase subunit 5 [Gasteruption parvicollarium]ALJ93745.1 NADH dehydrogenase subunit 5 [Gasteruption parvicollarium]